MNGRLLSALFGASTLLAAAALADTLRPGDRIAGQAPSAPALAYSITLPGSVGALAVHTDGRVAAVARQELALLNVRGSVVIRRAMPEAAYGVAFGAGEAVAAELSHGGAVLRYHDLFLRSWPSTGSSATPIAPAALPFGGFVFARGAELVFTDGEAHELRRLALPEGYEAKQLWVSAERGAFLVAVHGTQTALLHAGLGERMQLRAVLRGKTNDVELNARGLEIALEDGSLAHVALDTGAIQRRALPDDAYAVTAPRDGRAIVISKGQLAVLRLDGTARLGGAFGPLISRTDAGMVVPRVWVTAAGGGDPLWILTHDGSVWRSDDVEPRMVHGSRCDASGTAFFAASPGRVVIACQNRIVALLK